MRTAMRIAISVIVLSAASGCHTTDYQKQFLGFVSQMRWRGYTVTSAEMIDDEGKKLLEYKNGRLSLRKIAAPSAFVEQLKAVDTSLVEVRGQLKRMENSLVSERQERSDQLEEALSLLRQAVKKLTTSPADPEPGGG